MRQDLAAGSAGVATAVPDQHRAVGNVERLVGIVGRERDGQAVIRKAPDLAHDLSLIAEIEIRRRFVEKDDTRLLRQRSRDQGKLPLAAGNHGVGAAGEMGYAKPVDRVARDGIIIGRRRGKQVAMGAAPHQHDVLDRKGEGAQVNLRNISDQPGALPHGQPPERFSLDTDLSRERRNEPDQGLEQSRLAAAIGAEKCEHLAGGERNIERATDHPVAVTDGEAAALQDHGQLR